MFNAINKALDILATAFIVLFSAGFLSLSWFMFSSFKGVNMIPIGESTELDIEVIIL